MALSTGVALIALQPNLAKAQFWGGWDGGGARPWGEPPLGQRFQDEDLLRPGEIADVLRDHGWTILSPPSMSGRHYVANVRNGYGQRLFVVLDAYDGRILDARQIDERPNTNELAAIPGGYPPASRHDEVIRPVAPLPGPPTPAPKAHHSPSIQAKHSSPLRSTPLERPKEKEGTIAVAKPTATAPATKQVVPPPTTSAPETSSEGAPPPVATPAPSANVRQVYPGPGTPEPVAPAPKASSEAAPSTPPAPAHPAQAAPAKPVLPADAGYE
ncbi:MAG: hypothetical protein JO357_07695 [Hyphomicrobiales bacterium]|nr:hypothetical protein [Hyphomicrobiales bacterium]